MVGDGPTSVLKVGQKTDDLTCNDYLQMLDV